MSQCEINNAWKKKNLLNTLSNNSTEEKGKEWVVGTCAGVWVLGKEEAALSLSLSPPSPPHSSPHSLTCGGGTPRPPLPRADVPSRPDGKHSHSPRWTRRPRSPWGDASTQSDRQTAEDKEDAMQGGLSPSRQKASQKVKCEFAVEVWLFLSCFCYESLLLIFCSKSHPNNHTYRIPVTE